ncbi:MAG TPA: glycosyltransferase family 4 protein [Verrucomicrobiota bacterium]|nr:glycosyltransferase family 4 protein [Verrucomicrobiota bacterium]
MKKHGTHNHFALICDYVPRRCGIATFSHDVFEMLTGQSSGAECLVVPVNDIPEGYEYPPEVRFEIVEQDLKSYQRAADFLNFSDAEVVCLQHEFGIFGGPAGSHVLALLRRLRIPVVAHLHTILEKPSADQRRVMDEMNRLVARFIVMSERGRRMLEQIYKVAPGRIDVIPHGIPDMPFVDPAFYKDQFGVEGKKVLLTFGLIGPGKGIEYVLRALPEVVRSVPDLVYIILGATHPHLVRDEGEHYRLSLERLVAELGIKKHVVFYNRFVELEELKEFLGAADIYITPYLNPAQITSGTLAYAFGCGKAVISTPYWHAEELLADGRGVLVPFRDSAAIAREIIALCQDEVRRHAMRKQAYLLGREMTWSHLSHQFLESFRKAREIQSHRFAKRLTLKTQEQEGRELPLLRVDHLRRLSDSTGLLQHAVCSVPNFHEGYCTDDNARALLLTVLLEQTGDDSPEVRALASRYAAFLHYAFIPEKRRFHNFLSFDRRWLDDSGSDDCLGRALWALGTCVGRSRQADLQRWAVQWFEQALPGIAETTSPRAWAFALVGIHEYLQRLTGDRLVNQMRELLTQRLLDAFRQNSAETWVWFENILSYANAKLPHALILAGRCGGVPEALDVGLRSLRWLMRIQTAEAGHFRPIGSNGFYRKGGSRAQFDQQPVGAFTSVSACLEAWAATREEFWMNEARRAFEWFLGGNDLGQPVYDASTGGCFDALHIDRVNLNQGAESTLSFLLALQEMRLAMIALEAFERPAEATEPGPVQPAAV